MFPLSTDSLERTRKTQFYRKVYKYLDHIWYVYTYNIYTTHFSYIT